MCVDTKLISIIVPIYKVEQYLPRCIDSLINQTYRNIEIILVDDGSPDRCGEICDSYAKVDPRIIVVHKENGGLSDARNKGIDIATGDFVMFVDSDDWLESSCCETVVSSFNYNHADIVSFGIQLVGDNKVYETQVVTSPRLFTPREGVGAMIYQQKQQGLLNYVCNKAFQRNLFGDVRFPVGMLFEDQDVTYRLIHRARRIYAIDQVFYNYYQRESSIMAGSYKPKALHDRIAIWIKRYKFLCEKYPEYADYQLAQVLGDIYIALIKLDKKKDYSNFTTQIRQFANISNGYKRRLSKYSQKVWLHYYCYPLFWIYVKFVLKRT